MQITEAARYRVVDASVKRNPLQHWTRRDEKDSVQPMTLPSSPQDVDRPTELLLQPCETVVLAADEVN